MPASSLSFYATGSITLQVGERRFLTTKETLTKESVFFAALLGRSENKRADGSYFIDADPNLFEHILSYLRLGLLPLAYDSAKGHDLALYRALTAQAKYFCIPRLVEWFANREYLKAVTVTETMYELEGTVWSHSGGAGDLVLYHPVWETRKVYVCHRGIASHRGNPGACGRQCKNAQGDAANMFEEEQVLSTTMIVRRQTTIDDSAATQDSML
ncbi:MAG: hypothetical protein M1829_001485 [Trizodia sp. TS-e1964]|nr:MAG: hypothetical protein M1829_001485 [Trizodia sp. TS-e1964]